MVAIDAAPQTKPTSGYADQVVPPPSPPVRRRRWPLLLAALVVLIGLTLVSPAGRHQWGVSFVRQPTPYTALWFQDAASLPHTVTSGARIHLTVTVANHEGRRTDYPLVVSSANVGATRAMTVLHHASVTIPSGGQRSVSVAVRPACTHSACELQVSLPGHPEKIDVVLNIRRTAK
jgi:Protein of unknown function (DUF1616)